MNRRSFIKATGAGLAGFALRGRGQTKSPNVLLVIVDQMRRPVWFRGNHLHNYEALRSESVEFTNHFVCSVPCSPSRACLMTGLTPSQNGAGCNDNDLINLTSPTIGDFFRGIGYQTPYFGKWHLGDEVGRTDFEFMTPDFVRGSRHGEDKEIVNTFKDWLPNRGSDPWIAIVSYLNPHGICGGNDWRHPPFWKINKLPDNHHDFGKYSSIRVGRENSRTPEQNDYESWLGYLNWYLYFSRRSDDRLGDIISAVKDVGIYEDTLIIFTSDHGEMAGSHGMIGKPPVPFTEVLQVPLLWRVPNGVPGHITQVGSNMDVFATLAAMLGQTLDGVDGHDLFTPRPDAYAYFEASLGNGKSCYGQRDARLAWMRYPAGLESYDLVKDPLMLNPEVFK